MNGTFGHASDDDGDRYLLATTTPGLYAIPLPRRYLLRNPDVPTPSENGRASVQNATDSNVSELRSARTTREQQSDAVTGFAVTAMGGPAYFDRIALLRVVGLRFLIPDRRPLVPQKKALRADVGRHRTEGSNRRKKSNTSRGLPVSTPNGEATVPGGPKGLTLKT